jgi:hypothetical protein
MADNESTKMGWWARRAGIATIAGGTLFIPGDNNTPKPADPKQPDAHVHVHKHEREVHPTDPFPASIEYSAISDVLRSGGVKAPVPQSGKEWVKLLSRYYEIHAGFVPSSVAAPSSLKEPRIIISVSDPKRADRRNLSGKLFFGFVYHDDGTRDIEFISHNRQTKEFDFGKIEGAELRRPPIAKCLECHTDAKPFPLHFPYADTNFNPALSAKLIATLLSDDPAVIKRLKEITEAASKDKNPGAALNEMLVAEFGADSKTPLLYGGVPIVPRLSLDADLPLFDYETRKVINAEATAAHLAQIPDKSLRAQWITLSLKHTLAADVERTFSKRDANKKVHDATADFGARLDRLMAEHKELTPPNVDEVFEIPGGFGAVTMKMGAKDQGVFDIRKVTGISDIFARNAGGKRKQPPRFADTPGIAVNMGAADMPFLIDKAAHGLGGAAKNNQAAELLVDVLKSDRLDKLASSGTIPTRDEVMTVLVDGVRQEARKQHGADIAINRDEYIDTSSPVPQSKVEDQGGRLPMGGAKNPMQQHCYSCHGGEKPLKGPIPMDGQDWKRLFETDPDKARLLYQESIRRVDNGEMPRGKKLPAIDRRHIIEWLREDPLIPPELINPPKTKDR